MSGSVNKAIIVGNLGRDPESRQAGGGTVVNMTVATSERWKDKSSGERREVTEWHRVVIWNENVAGFVMQYAEKGSKVYVEGKLQTRKWTDKDGQERYTTEIVVDRFKGDVVLLDSAGDGEQRQSAGGQRQAPQAPDLSDDLPF